eukprot:SM000127S26661  [mRNA]  locus=s127:273743:277036:+ [translate_table: standard]
MAMAAGGRPSMRALTFTPTFSLPASSTATRSFWYLTPTVALWVAGAAQKDSKAVKRVIVEGFRATDEALLAESSAGCQPPVSAVAVLSVLELPGLDMLLARLLAEQGNWQDGATAVCAWIIEKKAYVANVGDAKAVLARCSSNPAAVADGGAREAPPIGTQSAAPAAAVLGGGKLRSLVVTREHKAIFPQERARIEKSGGRIESGRLQGRLEVSRAFGDRQFKKLGVTAIPDIHVFELTLQEHFLILGCDGLWGVLSPEDAVDLVQAQLTEGASIAVACKRLVREAVRERRCKDNCTAVLIVFA